MAVQKSPEDTFKAFIAQTIAAHENKPGALLGVLEAVQEKNPHKYLPTGNAEVHRRPDGHTAVANL